MFLAIAMAAICAQADTWSDPDTGYTWTYRINGDTAEIYKGWSVAISPSPTNAVTIPSSLDGKAVTSIGSFAFSGCSSLTSVTIPDNVTNIGNYAFSSCSSLTSVMIPESVTSIGNYAFSGCSGLTSVTIPDSVTSIGNYAFSSWSSLTSVTIPNSVTNIGNSAFRSCSGMTSVMIPDSLTSIGSSAFSGCSGLMSVMIPNSVMSIGPSAFSGCSGLTSVTIPDSVTSIGNYAFSDCSGLTSVTIPDGVTSIESSVFSGCNGLTNVTIPDWVTSIGSSAFSGCSGLMSVMIPNSVTSIGTSAFSGCCGLTSVTIPDIVTSIGNYAFSDCSGLTSVTIPDSVTSIGNYAFRNCSRLTSMMIGNGVTSIGASAFYGCSGLAGPLTIPDSVTSIGSSAFYGCSGLTGPLTIPDSVTSIGTSAFSGCSGLTGTLTIGEGVINIGDCVFSDCSGLVNVVIPSSVTKIDYSAFRSCSSLRQFAVDEGNPSYKADAGLLLTKDGMTIIAGVNGSVMIPSGVICIGEEAFYNRSNLTNVTIPNSMTNIGDLAFSGCSGLRNVTIPEGVISIGDWAFEGCSGLTNVVIPASVTSVGAYAFARCSGLIGGVIGQTDGMALMSLDYSQNHPFSPSLLKSDNANLAHVLLDTSFREFWKASYQYGHALCILDQYTLFDYLDRNDVPISLAMPCAERVPMITTLAPVGTVQVEFTPMRVVGTDTSYGVWRETSEANIKITANGLGLSSSLLFPFSGGKPPDGYTAQGFARLVFVASGSTAASSVPLRSNGFAKNLRPMGRDEWTTSVNTERQFVLEAGSSGTLSRTPVNNCLVVTFPSQGDTSWTPPANMQNEHDAWKDALLQLKSAGTLEKPILRKVDVYNLSGSAAAPTRGSKKQTYYEVLLRPFDENGEVLDIAGQYPDGKIPDSSFAAFSNQYTIRPYLVTWARVMQDDGETVDMVPATYEDDKVLNGIDNMLFNFPDIDYYLGNTSSDDLFGQHAMPIMRFQNSMSFTYADVNTASSPTGDWIEKSCYAVDPRFNWAPENWWFDSSDANPTGQKWYDAVFGNGSGDGASILNKLVQDEFDGSVNGRGDRANDPFLFVSNLGYLQSVGELAFLPHLSDMRENGLPSSVLGDSKQMIESGSHSGALYDGKLRTLVTVATMPCALAAWKSYQSFRTNPTPNTFEFGANMYRRGITSGWQGFYVNPYIWTQEEMVSAMVNTPFDYWTASTSNCDTGLLFKGGASGRDRDVTKIVMFLRRRFEDLANMIEVPEGDMNEDGRYVYQKVWEEMFDALDWGGTVGCTVEEVYDQLEMFYNRGDVGNKNYRVAYMRGNSYSDLNHFARGGGRRNFGPAVICLRKSKAVHKDDFGLKADPLRGQYADDANDTSCWSNLHDIGRKFLYSYWRDHFVPWLQLTDDMVTLNNAVFVYDGRVKEPTVTVMGGASAITRYDYEVTYTNNVDVGMATVMVTGRGRYTGIVEKHFIIKSVDETRLEGAFDGLPVIIESDDSNGWKVSLTNDLDLLDGPIEIPDDLGSVTIDLGGHGLVGTNGEDGGHGTTVLPGGDGQSAIMIVLGDGGDKPTVLTIVTTGGDATVKGGDGGDGNPGGKGAPAIGMMDCTKEGVLIHVGGGVTLQEGADGTYDTDGSECLNWLGRNFATGGDAAWMRVKNVSEDGYVLKSGAITHSQTSRLETVVAGPGKIKFQWKVSCEDYFVFRTHKILLDYLSFSVDGTEHGFVNGETDWTNVTFTVDGEGEHVIAWSYIKDSEGSDGEDCAWLDAVSWTPSGMLTGLEAWLADRNLTADTQAANGRTAAECYALGLDPTEATNDFRIVSIELVDGKPKVEWEPKTNRWTGAEIQAVLKGAERLEGPWVDVLEEGGSPGTARPTLWFFKVVVEGL